MFKKISIAGLLVALFIQKCKHIEELKNNKTKISIKEIDSLLDKSGLELTWKTPSQYTALRMNIKGLLHSAGILEDGSLKHPVSENREVRRKRMQADRDRLGTDKIYWVGREARTYE